MGLTILVVVINLCMVSVICYSVVRGLVAALGGHEIVIIWEVP